VKIAKFLKTILKTLLPHLNSDFSLVAFLGYTFYYLDLSPFTTKPLLECQPMNQYQKIENNIGNRYFNLGVTLSRFYFLKKKQWKVIFIAQRSLFIYIKRTVSLTSALILLGMP